MSIADVAKGFHDVTILASNAAELRRFYARLGFKQVVDRGDELAVFVVGRNELAIHTSAAQPANAVVLSILVDDLAPVQRHAAEMAIRVDGPIALRPGLTGISLLDPNGNKLEFLRPDAGKDMSDRNQSWYARPVFFVADCEKALRFYSVLGFREAWRHDEGGSLVAVQVNRDGAELILNRNAARAGGGRLFLSLEPGQVARCIEGFTAAGVKVHDEHWGMPVKSVRDPDGNDLLFHDDTLGGS